MSGGSTTEYAVFHDEEDGTYVARFRCGTSVVYDSKEVMEKRIAEDNWFLKQKDKILQEFLLASAPIRNQKNWEIENAQKAGLRTDDIQAAYDKIMAPLYEDRDKKLSTLKEEHKAKLANK
jgi:hypothetical protein